MLSTKILIVEDEQIIAQNLLFILEHYGYTNVDIANDCFEARKLMEQYNYELLLMDINLGDDSPIDGIDFVNESLLKYNFVYIYITANTDAKTLEKAKTTDPKGFIVKPFLNEAINANVELALNKISKNEVFVFSNKGAKQEVKLNEITHVEADGSYITIYVGNDNNYLVRKSLSDFHKEYPISFIRIHKSTLIHKNYIDSYSSQYVIVNGHKLPLGRTYKTLFLEKIKTHSSET